MEVTEEGEANATEVPRGNERHGRPGNATQNLSHAGVRKQRGWDIVLL